MKETKRKKAVDEKAAAMQAEAMQSPVVSYLADQLPALETARKKLAEMNLLDDFLFGSVVACPEIGERFVKILLKTIFGREFKYLSVTAQKVLYGTDSNLHGARLDVYIEPEEESLEGKAAVYDIEPDQKSSEADRKVLPRRVRFYHGKIAARSLNSGVNYDGLKNVAVIMILPYDPFGLNRMVYTVKNKCLEEPEMDYEDGASTLFLYTRGTKGASNESLKQMLHYMEESTYENAVNDDLREVHKMVEILKIDPETSISCVRLMEKIDRSEKEGEAKGNFQKLVTQVCKKRKLGQPIEKIAEDLVEEVSVIEPIWRASEKFAPEYDPEAVFEQIFLEKDWEKTDI